jgi:phage gpG-like protein
VTDFLHIDIQGLDKLGSIADQLVNPLVFERVLDEGAGVLFNRTRTRFLEAIDPDGVAWPVSGAAQERESRGRGGATLYDTGKLFESLQLYPGEQPGEREIGTDVPYGIFHQYGTGRLPIRMFLGFGEEDRQYMEALVIYRMSQVLGGEA